MGTSVPSSKVATAGKEHLQATLAALPLLFERNQGQFDPNAKFVAHKDGYTLALASQEATLWLASSPPAKSAPKPLSPTGTAIGTKHNSVQSVSAPEVKALHMTLVGANAAPQMSGHEPLSTRVNYFIGKDQTQWRRNISTVAKVRYKSVYPGIDLVYYGQGGRLEYDFLVSPSANPKQIQMRFAGMERLQLNARGELLLHLGNQTITQHPPVVYQMVNGHKRTIPSRYVLLSKREVGFHLGDYNSQYPLVIDPVLVYSTYVGGSSSEAVEGMAAGKDGAVYLAGRTFSPAIAAKFPVALGAKSSDTFPIFVAKINAAGTALEYLTYISGNTADTSGSPYQISQGIAVDGAGNAYVCGTTNTNNFPVANAFAPALAPRVENKTSKKVVDAFLFKLSSAGSSLLYSTYFGGSTAKARDERDKQSQEDYFGPRNAEDGAYGVAVDDAGRASIVGSTDALDLPTRNAFQPQLASASQRYDEYGDVFVATFDTAKKGDASLLYSTYFGSSGDPGTAYENHVLTTQTTLDQGQGIALDEAGNIYICGLAGTDGDVPFPIKNAFQSTIPKGQPGAGNFSAFVAKLNPSLAGANQLVFSTYLGGEFSSGGTSRYADISLFDVAVDAASNVYVAGTNYATTIAGKTPSTFGPLTPGQTAVLVAKIKSDGSQLVYASVLGGSNVSLTNSLAVSGSGTAYVAGFTRSSDFVSVDPLPNLPEFASSFNAYDTFLARLQPDGASLRYSTRLGSGNDDPYSYRFGKVFVALDNDQNVYVAGGTASVTLPIKNALQATSPDSGGANGFVIKIQGGTGLIVNSTGDLPDSDTSDGACSTGKTLPSGNIECTLRASIQEAIKRAPSLAPNTKQTIRFAITDGVASGALPKISLKSPLPSLDVPLILDGTTQPTVKRVWLNGVSGGAMSGLVVVGGDSLVKGLLINQVRGDGILIRTKGNNKIENCWIGLSDKGVADSQTGVAGNGVHILGSPNNVVGGATSDKRCVIGNNGASGVWIDGAASLKNSVQGCYIGTDVSGTQKAGNGKFGVLVGPETVSSSTKPLALNAQIGGAASVAGQAPGNVISASRFGGLVLTATSGAQVGGNLIGTDKSGTKALGNNIGVYLLSAPNNVIGSSRNVVSGNVGGMVLVNPATTGNRIQNNLVGTDASGTKALPNGGGIFITGAKSNTIGAAGAPNVVSGNKNAGISLTSSLKIGEQSGGGVPLTNLVQYNTVGLDKSGAKPLPNAIGVLFEGADAGSLGNTVANNVVSGNSRIGVVFIRKASDRNSSSTGNTLSANLVGTDATGTKAMPNALYGVLLQDAANNTVTGNTISGNGRAGVVLAGKYPSGYSPGLTEPGANGPYNNAILSNFIGTNKTGTSALANGASASSGTGAGLLVLPGCNGNPIGLPGKGNVISGNAGAGVQVIGEVDGVAQRLQGNFIGTGKGGTSAIANSGSGVSISVGYAWVGGTNAGEGNTLANNGGDGVTVVGGVGTVVANKILGNSIFSNKKLGIDLGGNGVTPNRAVGPADPKLPNGGQNFPDLVSAQVAGGKTNVSAVLKAAPGATYRVEFFVNATRDPSGYGEGQKFISAASVKTDGTGVAKFTATLNVALSGTQSLSMTASSSNGNTSEFSGLSRAITGRVYVTVTDSKNAKATLKQGIANVRVERFDAKGVVKETTGTDADGFYVFVGVPEGTWTIKPSSKTGSFDTQFDPATLKATVSADKPSVSGLDFTTYSIYGTVKDVAGKPLANQTVSLVGLSRSTKTGKDGTYRFDGLGKKQYDVEFGDSFSPHFKIVSLPTSGTAGISPNAKVDAQQGLSISGFVEDASGKPLANVPIELVGTNISPTVTDKDGRYEFDAILAGTYKVAPKSSAGKFTPASRTVTLKDKSIDLVDFTKQGTSTKSLSGGDS